MAVLLTVLAVFLILISCEYWWRKQDLHEEFSRKTIHILVGSFVAFWPYFLTKYEIVFLSIAFLAVVLVSKRYKLFSAIHSVQRPTNGELFFAVAVGLLALLPITPYIYTTALLVMSVADGLAAIIGIRFGKGNRYKIFGYTKSIVGSLTFLVVTTGILIGYNMLAPGVSLEAWIFPLALAVTAIENLGIRGLDNLAVPLTVATALQVLG